MYSSPKPALKEVNDTKKRLAKQLTDASRLIVDYMDSDDRRKVLSKADSLMRSGKRTGQLAGIILLKSVSIQPPYDAKNLTRFANFIERRKSEDIRYHVTLAFAETIKAMADSGFIDNENGERKITSIIETDMHDIMRTYSINPLLRRCAAVRALGILGTKIFYPSIRELMYHDPYDQYSHEPNLALVDAAAAAICDANLEGAFDELHKAYVYSRNGGDMRSDTVEGIVSIVIEMMHRIALISEMSKEERNKVFDFLLDTKYFSGKIGPDGTQPSL